MANLVRVDAEQRMAAAARARRQQEIVEERCTGRSGKNDAGRIYLNYARTISNRMLSLYDDCVLLLREDRTASACVLARCILETFAVGHFAHFEVAKSYESGGADKAGPVVLDYVNSSRIKTEEQKRLKKNKFSLNDYHFTAEAVSRMQKEEAASKHIMNALRHLFQLQTEATGQTESALEFVYEVLSEWTHPSQTSLLHAFTKETWNVPTSAGSISVWDAALSACSHGVYCVAGLPELRTRMEALAQKLGAGKAG